MHWVDLVCIILLVHLTFATFLSNRFSKIMMRKQWLAANAKEGDQSAQGQDGQSSAPLNVPTFTDQLSILKMDILGKIESVVGNIFCAQRNGLLYQCSASYIGLPC